VPRQVDHEQRRREVTAAATELVVTQGRAALTVRNVAEAVGCSTKVVSHYFDDMADLLHATYTTAASRARARVEAVVAADPTDVQGVIEALLPLDAARRRDWTIWFAFWTEALTSAALGADQRARARGTTARLATMLRALLADERLGADVDIAVAARRLGALVPGVAGQAMFDPTTWTAARQRDVVADELARLGVAARPSGR
jgi:AcrR family transcriptional regulator